MELKKKTIMMMNFHRKLIPSNERKGIGETIWHASAVVALNRFCIG